MNAVIRKFSPHHNTGFCILCSFLFCCTLLSCSENTVTPEDEIRQYIEAGKIAAEKRSHNDLSDLIDENYRDHKGLNKNQITKMARAYFFTHKNIHLYTQIESIELQDKNRAFVILNAAMAGSRISNISSLTKIGARVYKFELQLIKDNEWLLQQATWKRINLKDLL